MSGFNQIEDIVEDLREGRMVLMLDDEDRENEGDLVMAASMVRPDDINFMARYGRGLICLTLTRARCEQLRLPLMVSGSGDHQGTRFTLSIEAARGVTTGISAADRARTVQTAVAPQAAPEDLLQPGHVFPLMAQPGGVLTRAGHTEAGCDLARLAGFEPAAVIVEVLNEDGTMARRDDLLDFARAHDLKIGTVADLIAYRIRNERTVERVGDCELPTEHGLFHLYAYQDTVDGALHFALLRGQTDPETPALVRVQIENTLADLFGATAPDQTWSLRESLAEIAESESEPVCLVMLRRADDRPEVMARMREFQVLAQSGELTPEPRETNQQAEDLRTYGVGAQILTDLGIRRMRVLSAPKIMVGLSGFGMEVVDYVQSGAE
ncbi:3,4-dihydroxy-2-butanone 4-phosphate synthase [Spiribacter salinus M19-40]|uniref:3,4-dihydroxy-2-butanone 4-phosphate synthase n=2 Tax=Spiribacter salinus TaxID=1335746 RepID=R4V3I7_9GAMM|nr:bifunctional 3,4-dihydroxy-2-butanone-4-phosphate synthase/GTP cyclohydrolase II [Spiribacter salinus]AGM40569.1 3,4-dihydroxy-2-butanone 4-phosphate synthase [Spiribacter salinus M19-40]MDR9413398.1 bifunctional 3,4-dihydroxy-2-butanone-4-phosphate synthase/GTP cyclohydrolase II [Spiribacter sp.]MDR9454308.1 bifunctional 3,4-dihydroxy-2-butanone-4-phosphate synthase/GTP cyclohydrolase II [Spiribacter sp.]